MGRSVDITVDEIGSDSSGILIMPDFFNPRNIYFSNSYDDKRTKKRYSKGKLEAYE